MFTIVHHSGQLIWITKLVDERKQKQKKMETTQKTYKLPFNWLV